MANPVVWPRDVLKPKRTRINPAPATVAGVASLSGFRQAVASPAGVWSITYDNVVVATREQRLAFRALAGLVEGRATPILLPVFDREELRPIASETSDATFGDDATFTDGADFAGSRALAVADDDYAAGASMIGLDLVHGDLPEPGQHFSIGDRLYRIKRLGSATTTSAQVYIWPTLRDAVSAGDELELDRPVCKVRLMDDGGLDLALDLGRTGFPTVAFIEDAS